MKLKYIPLFLIVFIKESFGEEEDLSRCPECGECDQSFFLPNDKCSDEIATNTPLKTNGDVKRAGIAQSAHPYGHNLNCTHTIEVHCAPMKLTIVKFDIEDEDPKDNYISGDSRHHCEWDSIRLSWKEKDGQNSTCSPVFCGVVSQLEDYVWGQGTTASRMSDFKDYGENDPRDFGWMEPVYLNTTKVEIALHSDRSRSMYGFKIQYESGKECLKNISDTEFPCNTTGNHSNMICDESGVWKCDERDYYRYGDECKERMWAEWESWGDCSVANSAAGVKIRKRSCVYGSPSIDSKNCRKCNSSEPFSKLVGKDRPDCELDFRSCKAEETGANLEDKSEIGVISALKDNTIFSSKRTFSDSEQEGLGKITKITIHYCGTDFVMQVTITRSGANSSISIPSDSTRTGARLVCKNVFLHRASYSRRENPFFNGNDEDIFSSKNVTLGPHDYITGVRTKSLLIQDRFSIAESINFEISSLSGKMRVEPTVDDENTSTPHFITQLTRIGRAEPKVRILYTQSPDPEQWQLGFFSAAASSNMLLGLYVNWVKTAGHWTEWGPCLDSLENQVICNGTDSFRKRHKIVDNSRTLTTSCSSSCAANEEKCDKPCMECNRNNCPKEGTLALATPTKNPANPNLGVLVIYKNGTFGTVCDDEFNERPAKLACDKLGLGPLKNWYTFSKSSLRDVGSFHYNGSDHALHDMEILVDNINCPENATVWENCTWIEQHNCGHQEDVVIECEPRVDGWQRWSECDSDCNGGTRKREFKCYECTDSSCSRGCQALLANYQKTNSTIQKEQCNTKPCPEIGAIQLVTIKPDGKVETDPNLNKGIVRVFYQHENTTTGGEWGTVCDDKFTPNVGRVICRQLGFSGWKSNVNPEPGSGKLRGKIWMDDVICNGDESRLDECYKGQRVGGRGNNCDHEEDLYIECGEKQAADWSPIQSITKNGWTIAKASRVRKTHSEYRLYDGNRGNHFNWTSSGTCSGEDVVHIVSNDTSGSSDARSCEDQCVWANLNFNSSYTLDPKKGFRLWFSAPPRADVSVNVFVKDESSENFLSESKLCKNIKLADLEGQNSSYYDVACDGINEEVYSVNITSSHELCLYEIEAFAKENTVDPKWSQWSSWSECKPECENKMGKRYQYRNCLNRWAYSGSCGYQADRKTAACHHVDCVNEWDVKLTWNGKNRAEHGLVQVMHNGQWGTICNDSVNKTRVCELVCNKLGWQDCMAPDMGSSSQEQPNLDTPHKGIWLDDMDCDNRTRIEDCTHLPWGSHNCGRTENLVVKCGNRIPVPGDVLLGEKQIRNDYKNKTAFLQWNTTTSLPICGIDYALELVRGACHTETFFTGNVRLIDAPKNNTGGVLISNCPEGGIFDCYHFAKNENFKVINKCSNYYEITCGKVDRKTIATKSLIETPAGPDQRALYVLSNTATKASSQSSCKTLNMTLAMPKTAAENMILKTVLMARGHQGYDYWLGMTYDEFSREWRWDDQTRVEGQRAFTNFLPGQTLSTSSRNAKRCATFITTPSNSSGYNDNGKWRFEQCSSTSIHGLCSTVPGTDLTLIYKCFDCDATDKKSAKIFYDQKIESYRLAGVYSPPEAGISAATIFIALVLISSAVYFAYSKGLIDSARLPNFSCISAEEDNEALIADDNDGDDGTYASPIISLPDPKKKDKDVNKSTYTAFDSKIGYSPMENEDDNE